MKAIRRNFYLFTGAGSLGLAASLLLIIFTDEARQTSRLPLILTLAAVILVIVLAGREGVKLRAAELICENQILYIQVSSFQMQRNGKRSEYHSKELIDVFVSCFGLLLNSKIIKFNQGDIRLKAVEIGPNYFSFDYGTETSTENVRLIHAGADDCGLEEIIDRFRFETGIMPHIRT